MSEATYLLDLKNHKMLRVMFGRLDNMDTSLRKFPSSDDESYCILRSASITSYNTAEYIVHDDTFEQQHDVDTESMFVETHGLTDWNNSSIELKYVKYSTGEFSADLRLNISASKTSVSTGGDNAGYYHHYRLLVPVSIIKGVVEDSVSIVSMNPIVSEGLRNCDIVWKSDKTIKTSKPSTEGYKCYLRIFGGSTSSTARVNMTNAIVRFSGLYNMSDVI